MTRGPIGRGILEFSVSIFFRVYCIPRFQQPKEQSHILTEVEIVVAIVEGWSKGEKHSGVSGS